MSDDLPIDANALREEVKSKYRAVALDPYGSYHFHTGRPLAHRLGYDEAVVDGLPDSAVEAFAGVGNPFSLGAMKPGEQVVELGSGGGFDCFIAARQVGPQGRVVGIDMTEEMLGRSRAATAALQLRNVEFRQGAIEGMPIEDGWADVVISNSVINLCADKRRVFMEIMRVLKPDGAFAVCRYRNRKAGAGSGGPQHRPVDRLNRRRLAVRRLATDAGAKRVRRYPDRPAGRYLWWGRRREQGAAFRGLRLRISRT